MACLLHIYSITSAEPKQWESTKLARKRVKSKRFRDKVSEREAQCPKGNQDDDNDVLNKYS